MGIVRWHPQLAEAFDERRPPLAQVAVRPAADEAEAPMAESDEMVGAALLLCSEAASYIAGTDLMVTGSGHLPQT